MSRPRRPYGNPPGRLPATMIRVLAAEMSDSGRLSRGKRYWADHAVVDIVVGHGAVTAEIQGSRSQPYVVTIETRAGNGVPSKRDLWVRCTCPDDAGTGRDACKHAVAALFALSDEIAVEPELLDRWRGGLGGAHHDHRGTLDDEPDDDEPDDDEPDDDEPDDDDVDDGSTRTASAWPSNVVPLRPGLDRGFGARVPSRPPPEPEPEPDPTADEIATLLAAPAGARAPVFPVVEPLVHPPLRDHLLDEVLTDAISQLGLNLD